MHALNQAKDSAHVLVLKTHFSWFWCCKKFDVIKFHADYRYSIRQMNIVTQVSNIPLWTDVCKIEHQLTIKRKECLEILTIFLQKPVENRVNYMKQHFTRTDKLTLPCSTLSDLLLVAQPKGLSTQWQKDGPHVDHVGCSHLATSAGEEEPSVYEWYVVPGGA